MTQLNDNARICISERMRGGGGLPVVTLRQTEQVQRLAVIDPFIMIHPSGKLTKQAKCQRGSMQSKSSLMLGVFGVALFKTPHAYKLH